jgi:pimeloyl-ACP methyl ester carboxylesterase
MVKRIAALAVVLAIFATACKPNSSTASKPSPSPSSSPFTAGSIVWTRCGTGFQCGTVQVPLDYSHPAAGTIGIALVRAPATDQANRIGSVLINPGGPGASGIDWVRGSAPFIPNLNARFDLVGFDPRGVGQSAPVRCLDGRHEDAYFALDSVLDDPQEKQAAIQVTKDFVAGCAQMSAKLLPFVDTVSAAKDMDLMRAALGDDKLTYLGFSYGTFLGQTYAHLFPTRIRAIVLDAVVDPNLSATDLELAQLAGLEQNLQAFLSDCVARKTGTPPCAFAKTGDPAQKLDALVQRLDTHPLAVGTRMLTRALAITGVAWELYDQLNWPNLDQGLTQADQGDGRLLLSFADDINGRNADGTYTNEGDANSAINCLDRPVATDISAFDQLGPAVVRASPFFGPANQYAYLNCAYWPVKPTGQVGPLTAPGAPPILVVGGTNDPATPYQWAQAVNRQLAGSVLLTRHGNGHGSYTSSLCAQQAEDAYLIDLTLPAPGTVCNF